MSPISNLQSSDFEGIFKVAEFHLLKYIVMFCPLTVYCTLYSPLAAWQGWDTEEFGAASAEQNGTLQLVNCLQCCAGFVVLCCAVLC